MNRIVKFIISRDRHSIVIVGEAYRENILGVPATVLIGNRKKKFFLFVASFSRKSILNTYRIRWYTNGSSAL